MEIQKEIWRLQFLGFLSIPPWWFSDDRADSPTTLVRYLNHKGDKGGGAPFVPMMMNVIFTCLLVHVCTIFSKNHMLVTLLA